MSAKPLQLAGRDHQGTLLAELAGAGATVLSPTRIRCAFHDDRNPSAGVYLGEDGAWRFKCHGCGFHGDLYDVRAKAAGKPLADVIRLETAQAAPKAHRPEPSSRRFDTIEAMQIRFGPSASYRYTHPDTQAVEMVVMRFDRADGSKDFKQARADGGGFVLGAPPKPWPIYNRARIAGSASVVVVEGEKCVHALHRLGIVATTSPGGAENPKNADWSPLAGKAVVIWPDNDTKGAEYGRYVATEAQRLGCQVTTVDVSTLSLPPKGDVADFVDSFGGDIETATSAVRDVLADSCDAGPASEVESLLKDTISGKRSAIPWPWPRLSDNTKSLLPGTVTLLCGDPGATKSFMLLEALCHWHHHGIKSCVYELEEDRAYHLYRCLVQLERNAKLFDDSWVKANPHDALEAHGRHAEFLDSLGGRIYESPDKQVNYDTLTDWIKARASEGFRVIAIDPVTAIEPSREPWVADSRFIIEAKVIARNSGASIVLVTHPRKGRKGLMGLDELAGGAAFQRFAQTVLWMEYHKESREVAVVRSFGTDTATINRTLHIAKSRNGSGQGLSIGFVFNSDSLCLEEVGTIRRNP